MALTNFSGLNSNQLTLWQKDLWSTCRQNSFVMQLAGSGPQAMIHRVTELSGGNKGTQARITLVPDMTGDGVMGDTQLWDSEEQLTGSEQLIRIDQIRNATRIAGKLAEQKVVVRFRETARDVLGFWIADRLDQLFFLTASGIPYYMATNGAARTGYTAGGTWASPSMTQTAAAGKALDDLEFNADITAPSSKRWFRWVAATSTLTASTTSGFSSILATDLPSYRMLVELKAYAKDRRIRPLKMNGMDAYHVFLHPKQMAKLKLDSDFLANVRNAGVRGDSNPLFSGSVVTIDGLILHENTHVFNTAGATAGASGSDNNKLGYKWGASAQIDGARMLLCGAQAVAFADIGAPSWEEDTWDFKNQHAISVGKVIGFKKPVWTNTQDGSSEDYGVIAVDTAI